MMQTATLLPREKRPFWRQPWLWLAAIFVLLYTVNIGGWLLHDDEGTDFYEVWQYQEGAVPGEDFIAAQQPLFLIAGGALVEAFGQTAVPLRLLAAVQVLFGAAFLAWAWGRVVNGRFAMLVLGFTLGSGAVYELARLFRPDPMMFAWELVGLGCALLAIHGGQRRWWAAAGAAYGLSILWKPFGVLPVIGLIFYFLSRLVRQRHDWRRIVADGVAFSIPFLLASAGLSILFYAQLGFYYLEPLNQHQQLGQANTIWDQVRKLAATGLFFIVLNPFWLLIPLLRWLNKRRWPQPEINQALLWQLASPLIFLAVTRPLFPRYFLYLTPVFAILLAQQVTLALAKLEQQRPSMRRHAGWIGVVLIAFVTLTAQPSILDLLLRREADTQALAQLVAANTEPTDVVLADYAGINFFADRPSIYEASIIAGGKVAGGIITGELLIDRIESDDVQMVLIHVAGGDPPPHQLSELQDRDRFQAYLDVHFTLLTTFNRAGQEIEVYQRR